MALFNEAEARERLLNLPMEENNLRDLKQISRGTDKYFTKSRKVAERVEEGKKSVVSEWATFIRQPVIFAPAIATAWLNQACKMSGVKAELDLLYHEGDMVGAGDPMFILRGSFPQNVEFETHYLQKIGKPCVAAYNAFKMASSMPNTAFLDMAARHNSGPQETEMMSYAASVGSLAAQQRNAAKGFIGSSTDIGAKYFDQLEGKGTMPHALIGYFADTVEAAKEYHSTFPDEPLTVLCDFEGLEVTKTLALGKEFPELMDKGLLSVRIDTNGARYLEGLDPQKSYEVLEKHVPDVIRGDLTDSQRETLIGKGVSAAAIWYLRDQLNQAGMQKLNIVPSSGFGVEKCKTMAMAGIDTLGLVVGTGSYLPEDVRKTYATSDIISYDGQPKIKEGRGYLIDLAKKREPVMTLELG